MAAFWSLFLLAAYGILGGFIHFTNGVLRDYGVDTTPWMRQVPLMGDFGVASLIAVILQLIVGLVLWRLLRRPKTVEYLIETEGEMRKVVWPSWKDTRTGAVAVIITVAIMLVFLLAVDAFFLEAFNRIFSLRLGG